MGNAATELMTPPEAARWFRRSTSWLRMQRDLLCLRTASKQPLYHVRVCRAFVLGKLCELESDAIRAVQLRALAEACGLDADERVTERLFQLCHSAPPPAADQTKPRRRKRGARNAAVGDKRPTAAA